MAGVKNREREREWLYNCVQEGDGLKLLDWLGEETAQLVFFDPQYRDTAETTNRHVLQC